MTASDTLGIIAGAGLYPLLLARAARTAGVSKIVVAAFEHETSPKMASCADEIEWMRVGQLGKLIKFFRQHGVTGAMMAGQIAPKNLFDLRPDLRTLVMLGKLKLRNAESIFSAIGAELAAEGITLLPATTYLEDLLPRAGLVYGAPLKARQMEEVVYSFQMAKEMSRLDVGQSVVVKRGTVLAVEAFEGTDECAKRGGALGKGQATLAKVSKPGQDLRFDVPVIGPRTIEVAAAHGISTVVIEAGLTIILGREEVQRLCEQHRLTLYAMEAAS